MALSVKNGDIEEDASGDRKASLKAARGPLLALGATVFSGTSSEFTALGSKGGIPGFQLLFFLRLTQFLTVLVCLAIFRPKLIGENRLQNWLLLLEMLIHNLSTALVLLSFTYAAPGIAFGIIQGALPLFTAGFGFIFLKEKIGPIPCCGILISVTGVVLVSIGMATQAVDASRTLVVSILLPVSAAFTKAPDFVLRRAILKDVSGTTLYLYVTSLGTVALLILTFACETPVWTMSAEIAGYVAGVGLSQTMVMLFFIAVLKVEKAAIAVGLRTLVIPFTIILDYFILSVVPNVLKWAGLGLVVLGAVVLNAHTYWAHCQEEKRSSFLEKMGISLPESEKK